VKHLGALLAAVALGNGCGTETWDSGDAGASPPDVALVIAEAGAPADATLPDADAARRPTDAATDRREQGPSPHCEFEGDCALGLHCLLGDASPGECVPCVVSADCQDPMFQHCDPESNRCVQCDVNADCRQGEVCLTDPTHTCVQSCSSSQACPPRAGYCDPQRSLCIGCSDAFKCGIGQTCDPASGQCGECASDSDCHTKPFIRCDRTTSKCVECFRNSDCGRGVCLAGGICFGFIAPRGDG
jgi:Cys-rich repeat protein